MFITYKKPYKTVSEEMGKMEQKLYSSFGWNKGFTDISRQEFNLRLPVIRPLSSVFCSPSSDICLLSATHVVKEGHLPFIFFTFDYSSDLSYF
jgi:hypothetical protein